MDGENTATQRDKRADKRQIETTEEEIKSKEESEKTKSEGEGEEEEKKKGKRKQCLGLLGRVTPAHLPQSQSVPAEWL